MRQFIKIDLSTIKKNPNAGRTITVVMGEKTINFMIKDSPSNYEWMKDGDNVCITHHERYPLVSGGYQEFFQGFTKDDSVAKKIYETVKVPYEIGFSQDAQKIRTLPECKWLYEYEPIKIKCPYCGNEFSHAQLVLNDDSDDYWSNIVFPCCEKFEYYEFEYEDIEDALKRMD